MLKIIRFLFVCMLFIGLFSCASNKGSNNSNLNTKNIIPKVGYEKTISPEERIIQERGKKHLASGIDYQEKGDLENAIDCLNKAILEFEKSNVFARELWLSYYLISIVSIELKNFSKAKEYLGKAIPVFLKAGFDNNDIAELYSIAGDSARKQGPDYYNFALEFYKISLDRYKKEKNKEESIGKIYNAIANIYLERNKLYKAKKYSQKGISIMTKANIGGHELGHLYNTFGNVCKKKGSLEKSLEYYLKAAHELEEYNIICPTGLHYIYANIGYYYKGKKEYNIAYQYFKKALIAGKQIKTKNAKFLEAQIEMKNLEYNFNVNKYYMKNLSQTEQNIMLLKKAGWIVYDTPGKIDHRYRYKNGVRTVCIYYPADCNISKKAWLINRRQTKDVIKFESSVFDKYLDNNIANDEIDFITINRSNQLFIQIISGNSEIGKETPTGQKYMALKELTRKEAQTLRKISPEFKKKK